MSKANTGAFPPPVPDPETVLASLLGGVVVLTQDNLIAHRHRHGDRYEQECDDELLHAASSSARGRIAARDWLP